MPVLPPRACRNDFPSNPLCLETALVSPTLLGGGLATRDLRALPPGPNVWSNDMSPRDILPQVAAPCVPTPTPREPTLLRSNEFTFHLLVFLMASAVGVPTICRASGTRLEKRVPFPSLCPSSILARLASPPDDFPKPCATRVFSKSLRSVSPQGLHLRDHRAALFGPFHFCGPPAPRVIQPICLGSLTDRDGVRDDWFRFDRSPMVAPWRAAVHVRIARLANLRALPLLFFAFFIRKAAATHTQMRTNAAPAHDPAKLIAALPSDSSSAGVGRRALLQAPSVRPTARCRHQAAELRYPRKVP